MIRSDRQGIHFSQNLIDSQLSFNDEQSWTISSGTGTATIDNVYSFNGFNSLKLENTSTNNALVASNTTQSTLIANNGTYGFSCYLLKTQALEIITGKINIFKNAALLQAETFSIGSSDAEEDKNECWLRYVGEIDYPLLANDVITFTVEIDGSATLQPSILLYVDGMMFYRKDRNQQITPFYTEPLEKKESIVEVSSTYSSNAKEIVFCDASGAAFDVNLPDATTVKKERITVHKSDSSVNVITINANGGDLINGASNTTLTSQYETKTLFCDGLKWIIL